MKHRKVMGQFFLIVCTKKVIIVFISLTYDVNEKTYFETKLIQLIK